MQYCGEYPDTDMPHWVAVHARVQSGPRLLLAAVQ